MIIDADIHYAHPNLFDHISFKNSIWEEYSAREKKEKDLRVEGTWQGMYNSIKDQSWPLCPALEDFHTLPLTIRKEIAETQSDSCRVDSDFLKIELVDTGRYLTAWQLENIFKNFLKTDRGLLILEPNMQNASYAMPKEQAVEFMQVYNKFMLAFCQENQKFDVVAWLALQDLEASKVELDKIIDQDFFGVFMSLHPGWGFIPGSHYIFDVCAKKKMPVYLHPTAGATSPADYFLNWENDTPMFRKMKLKWPEKYETWKIMAASLITESVLERNPNLRIAIAERGVHWIHEVREFLIDNGYPDPLPYFKNNFWYTADPERPTFLEDGELVGWNHILFATDWPHIDEGGIHKFKDVELLQQYRDTGKITASDYDCITHKNYLFLKNKK